MMVRVGGVVVIALWSIRRLEKGLVPCTLGRPEVQVAKGSVTH